MAGASPQHVERGGNQGYGGGSEGSGEPAP